MFVTNCRMCGSGDLYKFLDLGRTPPADQFPFETQLDRAQETYPLEVVMCDGCGLAQLNYVVPAEVLYCDDYPYESSTTAAGRRHWQEFARVSTRMLGLGASDLVIDVGSNVGVLLQMFRNEGTRVLGIDPAANIAEIANGHGIETIPSFFNLSTARQVVESKGKASLITATNVFAHIDDLHQTLQAVDLLLNEKGVFVIEAPYFGELLQNLEYDTIYHEHLSYLSLRPLVQFFDRFGMEVFEVQRRDIHGGSFRTFVRRKGSIAGPVASIVEELLAAEERDGIYEHQTLDRFAEAVARNRADLNVLLRSLKAHGKRIVGVSAPAKGMTLLNYCGIDKDLLDFVTEKSTLKIGRFTPGAHIPIVSDDALLARQPDYALLLAWNFAEEIMNNLSEFSARGGKFIIPVPTPKIVG